MPFPEIIEPPIVGTGPSKEAFESGGVMFRGSDKMGCRANCLVDRELDDPKMIWRDLLAHQDAADLVPSGAPQAFAKACALVTWETDRDHRMPRVTVRAAA